MKIEYDPKADAMYNRLIAALRSQRRKWWAQ
jgi:uncharacterized protein YuzE